MGIEASKPNDHSEHIQNTDLEDAVISKESGGLHIFELHLPVHFSAGILVIALIILGGLALAYIYWLKDRKQARKRHHEWGPSGVADQRRDVVQPADVLLREHAALEARREQHFQWALETQLNGGHAPRYWRTPRRAPGRAIRESAFIEPHVEQASISELDWSEDKPVNTVDSVVTSNTIVPDSAHTAMDNSVIMHIP